MVTKAARCAFCGAPIVFQGDAWVHASDGDPVRRRPRVGWSVSIDGQEFHVDDPRSAVFAGLLGFSVAERIVFVEHHRASPRKGQWTGWVPTDRRKRGGAT